MTTTNFRGYKIQIIPLGDAWKLKITYQTIPCFHELEKERFSNLDAAFVRGCEEVSRVLSK